MNKLLKIIRINNMPKLLLGFFIYTIITFLIGILCKVLVAWHVNDMHTDLAKTHELFKAAAEQGGSFKDFSIPYTGTDGALHTITLGDLMSLDYLSAHQKEVSAGDGSLDRFYVYSKHFMGHESEFIHLQELLGNFKLSFQTPIDISNLTTFFKSIDTLQIPHTLDLIAGFQNDIARDVDYVISMQKEANLVFWLQIILIILTLAAYPYGIYRMWLIKHDTNYTYNAKMHRRFIIEYLFFLLFFIIIDTYATYLLIAEHVPMTFWNAFSVGSMAIPTGFAIGSLIYIHFNKKIVSDPKKLKKHFFSRIKV